MRVGPLNVRGDPFQLGSFLRVFRRSILGLAVLVMNIQDFFFFLTSLEQAPVGKYFLPRG